MFPYTVHLHQRYQHVGDHYFGEKKRVQIEGVFEDKGFILINPISYTLSQEEWEINVMKAYTQLQSEVGLHHYTRPYYDFEAGDILASLLFMDADYYNEEVESKFFKLLIPLFSEYINPFYLFHMQAYEVDDGDYAPTKWIFKSSTLYFNENDLTSVVSYDHQIQTYWSTTKLIDKIDHEFCLNRNKALIHFDDFTFNGLEQQSNELRYLRGLSTKIGKPLTENPLSRPSVRGLPTLYG